MGNKACALPCINNQNYAEAELYDARGMNLRQRKTKLLHATEVRESRSSAIYSQLIDRDKFI